MNIKGKIVLITGGAAGIGLAVAKALAEAGAAGLIIGDVDDVSGRQAAAAISQRGCKCIYRHTDVSDWNQFKALFDEADRSLGPVNIVFNNAGIMLGNPGWPDVSLERIGLGVQVNLLGVMYGTRIAIDILSRGQGGIVINTASPAGFAPMPNDPMYSATKAAIINFSMACQPLHESHNVRVNAIMPGVTDTAILKKSGDGETPAEWLQPLLGMVNMLTVEDIAKGVIELIEDDSRAGEALSVENPIVAGGEVAYVRLRDSTAFHERALGR